MEHSFLVAVRRDKRSVAPTDWKERVSGLEGVKVLSDSGRFLAIQATPDVLNALRGRVGEYCNIEREAEHRPLTSPTGRAR